MEEWGSLGKSQTTKPRYHAFERSTSSRESPNGFGFEETKKGVTENLEFQTQSRDTAFCRIHVTVSIAVGISVVRGVCEDQEGLILSKHDHEDVSTTFKRRQARGWEIS